MSAVNVPKPNFALPIVDKDGFPARWFRDWISGLHERSGGSADKVDAAHTLARGAVPQGAVVAAAGGLQAGGVLGSTGTGLALYVTVDTVANLPAGAAEGDLAYAVDGRKIGEGAGSGTGVPCWWTPGSPGAWYAVDSGAVVAA